MKKTGLSSWLDKEAGTIQLLELQAQQIDRQHGLLTLDHNTAKKKRTQNGRKKREGCSRDGQKKFKE